MNIIYYRIFWSLILIGAVSSSTYLIYRTYRQWVTSPIIVTFTMTETPISEIPFPAVTICPEVIADPFVFNFTNVYLKYSNGVETTFEEDYYFNLYSLVCNENLDFINNTETQFISLNDRFEFLDNFGNNGIDNCKWLGKDIECNNTLQEIITQEGWCSTFNMLAYEENLETINKIYKNSTLNSTKLKSWSLEKGYPPGAGLNAYPRRTKVSGINGGLQIDFEVDKEDLDYLCSDLQGYKVTLHHPAEVPDMNKYFRVPLDSVVLAAIKPRMITTSDNIKSYNALARQCYMPGEKHLVSYKIYSQRNCLVDCLANFTLARCGCSIFYLPVSDIICGAGSKGCVNQAKVDFLQDESSYKLNNEENELKLRCDCLPACTSLLFDAETSQTDWDWRIVESIKFNPNDVDLDYLNEKKHKSRLIVYFKDLQFMTSERHELYGPIDFLANCGGLLGLCCGFSLTSLMEIIYYLTLRLYGNVSKFGYKIWSGSEELTKNRKKR